MNFYKACLLICFGFFLSCQQEKSGKKETPVIPDSLPVNQNQFVTMDQSPMDMSYYPASYPIMKMEGKTNQEPVARVIYSRPHRKARKIFGDSPQSLCKYGKQWRLGANEATEIEFYRDVIIGGKNIQRGTYILYCIPYQDHWTMALNSNLHTWGLHMDSTRDVLRTDIAVENVSPSIEDFSMVFMQAANGMNLLMAWDDVKAVLPISFTR